MGIPDEMHNKKTHQIEMDIMENIEDNITVFEQLFADCMDIVKKKFQIGEKDSIWGFIAYIDVLVDRKVIEQSVLEKIIEEVKILPEMVSGDPRDLFDFIKDFVIASADLKVITSFDEVCKAVLSGDTAILIDGYEKGLAISTRGWPMRSIVEPDAESVVKGSKDGFVESMRFNTVLIRRRIRDTKLKVLQEEVGIRSRTDIAICYMEDIVRTSILEDLKARLKTFEIDAIYDTGMLEELLEPDWKSPFPRLQVTQRPDKVASSLMDGRIAVVVDNSPFVILLPTTMGCLFQSSEDYNTHWMLSSMIRFLRYVAAFIAISLPGLFIAMTCFHPSMLPVGLVYSIAASRQGVPFPAIIEILILELEFELLREAGIRLPGPIGNTIGIVGGLIIGQSAVEANLVSPIMVLIVAVTAIASYSIPNYAMMGAYRILKFWIIFMCSVLGLFGFWLGTLVVLIHLVSLKSFEFPYMMPYVSTEMNEYNDFKDSFFRLPLVFNRKRPLFANQKQRKRLKINQP